MNLLHIPTSGLYHWKRQLSHFFPSRRRSSDGALSRLHHRRTVVRVCPISSPRWPRRPFTWTKASTKRQNAIPTPSASNEGQVFKGGGSLASYGEQHTDRAARAEGRRERRTVLRAASRLSTKMIRVLSANIRRRTAVCSHQSADVCRFHDWWRD